MEQWRSHRGGQGGAECSAPPPQRTCQKSGKRGGNREKEEKIGKKRKGRKGKNREGSFTLPLLTDRAGYATVMENSFLTDG